MSKTKTEEYKMKLFNDIKNNIYYSDLDLLINIMEFVEQNFNVKKKLVVITLYNDIMKKLNKNFNIADIEDNIELIIGLTKGLYKINKKKCRLKCF